MLRPILFFFFSLFSVYGVVLPGIDVLLEEEHFTKLKDKKVALLTNHTGVSSQMKSTLDLLQEKATLVALFSPEHGLKGQNYAWESIKDREDGSIPIYSLHGDTRRPKPEMFKDIDILIYDIQCTGVRAYTYPTTLFYAMEEAAKAGVEVFVLDRPDPCLLYTSPSPRDRTRSRMPSSA